jgi:Fe-S oxidoreductase
MLTTPEQVLFILVVMVSAIFSYKNFSVMKAVIQKGQGALSFGNFPKRLAEAASVFIFQKTVFKNRPVVSVIHSFLAWAFMFYFLVNIADVLWAFIPNFHFLGTGILGDIYRAFTDVFTVLALLAMIFFLIRRFVFGTKQLTINENVLLNPKAASGMRKDSLLVGIFILCHIGFRFLGESFTLAMNGADSAQPFASAVSLLWGGMESATLIVAQHISWWLAIGLILAFIPYFPNTKHAHLFMAPINFFTRPHRSAPGMLDKIDLEDEEAEQFGAAKFTDLDKTQILDSYACIMCNRCQDACPAYITGKELSPSALEINKRYFLKENAKKIAAGEAVETSFLEFGLSESALWACTSCAACVEVCPVGNEPMLDILNIRRDRVLMESQFPKELQNAFNGMERNQNPWNMNDDRLKWVKEDETLTVKTVEENPEFDVLYWVGCAGAFDAKGQEIARSFSKIMNKAGVNFSVLGNNEACTGDSARRAGNEYLFQTLAAENIEILNRSKVKKMVTTCPHCLHTLKNEYPQLGGNYEVIHHTQFIDELISSGKLKLTLNNNENITYHDPCYLGRHNKIYDEPRTVLGKSGFKLNEMDNNKQNSLCCSAGGAQMWKEEEQGTESIRQRRFKEAQQTKSGVVCTSCPFCLTMMRDASNELESNIQVKDIAQVVAEQLDH